MRKGWRFWFAALAVAGCAAGGGRSEVPGAVAITVTPEGFEPAVVTVTRGSPVTLVVTRKTEQTCAKEFVMAAQGIRERLPLNRPVVIRFTPTEGGELRYACGMDMIAGKIIVR
jgi:plastocyanin domain-containing protein